MGFNGKRSLRMCNICFDFVFSTAIFVTMCVICSQIRGRQYWNRIDMEALPDFTEKWHAQGSGTDFNDPLNVEWLFLPTCRVLYHEYEKDGVTVDFGGFGIAEGADIVNFEAGVDLLEVQTTVENGVTIVSSINGQTVTEEQRAGSKNLYTAIGMVKGFGEQLALHYRDAFQQQWDEMCMEVHSCPTMLAIGTSKVGSVERWPNQEGNSLWVVETIVSIVIDTLNGAPQLDLFPNGLRFSYFIGEDGEPLAFDANDNVCGTLGEEEAHDSAMYWKHHAWMRGSDGGISSSWLVWMALAWWLVRVVKDVAHLLPNKKQWPVFHAAMVILPWVSNWLIAPFTFIQMHEEIPSMITTFYSFPLCVFWTLIVCLSMCCCLGDVAKSDGDGGPAFFAIPWGCGLVGALIFFGFFIANYGSWTLIFGLNLHFRMSWPHIDIGATVNAFTVLVFLMFPNDVLSSTLAGLSMVDKGYHVYEVEA
jgi:hypothetical protein